MQIPSLATFNGSDLDFRSGVTLCPFSVDGMWSCWSSWSKCSATCGGGHYMRTRSCTNPAPAYGGDICLGLHTEEALCSTQPCPGKRRPGCAGHLTLGQTLLFPWFRNGEIDTTSQQVLKEGNTSTLHHYPQSNFVIPGSTIEELSPCVILELVTETSYDKACLKCLTW